MRSFDEFVKTAFVVDKDRKTIYVKQRSGVVGNPQSDLVKALKYSDDKYTGTDGYTIIGLDKKKYRTEKKRLRKFQR